MKTQTPHQSVLLDEALEALAVRPAGRYLDGTFGRGGHSRAILARLGEAGRLLALDRDPDAIAAGSGLVGSEPRLELRQARFSELKALLEQRGWSQRVDGVLLDLGVSSPQLDEAARGFSFQKEGPLDMRMDPGSGISLARWLATATAEDIARVLWEYGEERHGRRIAKAIVAARGGLHTTLDLAQLIVAQLPRERGRRERKHPATRSFQALRIYINDELGELEQVLPSAAAELAPGGRLAVISFHSLEDRMVKRFMRRMARADADLPPDLPIPAAMLRSDFRVIGGAVRSSEAECEANPRARSAVLRTLERLP